MKVQIIEIFKYDILRLCFYAVVSCICNDYTS